MLLFSDGNFSEMINNPVRKIVGRVEHYEGSTLINIFKATDALKSFSIERIGEESKFFGFGICQKLNVKLRDTKREISVKAGDYLEAVFGVGTDYAYTNPQFKITEVHRDEINNELSITAYDALYAGTAHTFAEFDLTAPYTIKDVATACASLLGLPLRVLNGSSFDRVYESGANFEGSETIREVLNAIAEATQTIYYVNNNWCLTFVKVSNGDNPVLTIDKSKYFDLDSKTNRRLATICHATELGDNVSASLEVSGSTQYVRDNPFWDLREDIDTIVEEALTTIGGLTINQFECSWRGNFLLEIGDRIGLITKDGETVLSNLLNDTIEYDGGFRQKTQWKYEDNEEESESNPSSLGDVLKQTYARVDKANKNIEMLVSQVNGNNEAIANLQLTTDEINATVQKSQEKTTEALEGVNSNIATLTNKVEASMTAEDVKLEISTALEDGVSRVETTTGFTFNETGLTVSRSGSEMTTTITEDGMTVYRDSKEVLIADNEGVKAEDLHATTYLLIGKYSRLEDYGNRTGCFWIG